MQHLRDHPILALPVTIDMIKVFIPPGTQFNFKFLTICLFAFDKCNDTTNFTTDEVIGCDYCTIMVVLVKMMLY
jgi:hypothetical protein